MLVIGGLRLTCLHVLVGGADSVHGSVEQVPAQRQNCDDSHGPVGRSKHLAPPVFVNVRPGAVGGVDLLAANAVPKEHVR